MSVEHHCGGTGKSYLNQNGEASQTLPAQFAEHMCKLLHDQDRILVLLVILKENCS
jgi:hypothetical protein